MTASGVQPRNAPGETRRAATKHFHQQLEAICQALVAQHGNDWMRKPLKPKSARRNPKIRAITRN